MCSSTLGGNPCQYEQDFLTWKEDIKEGSRTNVDTNLSFELPRDSELACIFHSEDLEWKRNNLFADYLRNYILLASSDPTKSVIEFVNIQFVANTATAAIDFSKTKFTKDIKFKKSTFANTLNFRNVKFSGSVDFFLCHFRDDVYFNESEAQKSFAVNNCHFHQRAYFNYFLFNPENAGFYPSFNQSVFRGQANFPNTRFSGGDANFQLITFQDKVYFTNSVFDARCLFQGTRFEKESDFSNVEFCKEAFFTVRDDGENRYRVEFINPVTFASARVHDAMRFDDAIFAEANFDKISLSENGRMYFKGTLTNKMFTRPIAFHIKPEDIKGYIDFENAKVASIHKANLKALDELSAIEQPKVFFRDGCEFFVNSEPFFFNFDNSTLCTVDVLKETFHCLERWLSTFTSNENLILELNYTKVQHKQFGFILRWERVGDLNLFKVLSSYFFECLEFGPSILSNIEKKFKEFSIIEDVVNKSPFETKYIKRELKDIIAYFQNFLSGKMMRAKCISLNIDGKKTVIKWNGETSNSEESVFDSEEYAKALEIIITASFNHATKIQASVGNAYLPVPLPSININNIMSTTLRDLNITGDQAQVIIGSDNNAINQPIISSSNSLDFTQIKSIISEIINQLKAAEIAQDHEFYQKMSDLHSIEKAADQKDENKIRRLAKGLGAWLKDVSSHAGGSALHDLIKGLYIFGLT